MSAWCSASLRVLALTCTLMTYRASAQEPQPPPKLWTASALALSAAIAADAVSSIRLNNNSNLRESNGLLASGTGRFDSGRAIGIQAGLAACILIPEYLLLRQHPKLAKAFSSVNFGLTAIPTSAAIHNFALR